jgi:hypothetical protein
MDAPSVVESRGGSGDDRAYRGSDGAWVPTDVCAGGTPGGTTGG